MNIVMLGHMGRDVALADRLPEHRLHVIGEWANPNLVDSAERSGGNFHPIDSIGNVESVADLVQAIEPDMFVTNFDDALAKGVVDAIQRRVAARRMPDLLIPCPDQASSRIEWDKFYLRELLDEDERTQKYNPLLKKATTRSEVLEAIAFFEAQGIEIVIKPRNLTGGKGVKVQGKEAEYATYADFRRYAMEILERDDQAGLEIQEKLEGHEFTLQIKTDGKTIIEPPVTYDYPFRFDNDEGPGTGGMGTHSMADGLQPFLDEADKAEAIDVAQTLLAKLAERGHNFKGTFYTTFFKTAQGLKMVEVNARGGDPEYINIMDLVEDDVDMGEVLKLIAKGELAKDSVRYKKLASAMLYLVSPSYGHSQKDKPIEFGMDPELAKYLGVNIRFAAGKKIGHNRYSSTGTSRVIGLSVIDRTPWEGRQRLHEFIMRGFNQPLELDYRLQVAEQAYIESLAA